MMRYSLVRPSGETPYDYIDGWCYSVVHKDYAHNDPNVGVVTSGTYHRFYRPSRSRMLGWDIVSCSSEHHVMSLVECEIAIRLLNLGFTQLPHGGDLKLFDEQVQELGCGYDDKVRMVTAFRLACPERGIRWMT